VPPVLSGFGEDPD